MIKNYFRVCYPIILLFSLCISVTCYGRTGLGTQYLDNAKLVGQGHFSYGFWDVYDAKLYAENGKWHPNAPFVLTINCLRDLDSEDVANSMIDEIRRQGYSNNAKITKWNKAIRSMLHRVNLKNKATLAGVKDKMGYTHFYSNGKLIATIKDKIFTDKFFNIWLGKNTATPYLRQQLLGLGR